MSIGRAWKSRFRRPKSLSTVTLHQFTGRCDYGWGLDDEGPWENPCYTVFRLISDGSLFFSGGEHKGELRAPKQWTVQHNERDGLVYTDNSSSLVSLRSWSITFISRGNFFIIKSPALFHDDELFAVLDGEFFSLLSYSVAFLRWCRLVFLMLELTLGVLCWVSGKRHISAKAFLLASFFFLFRSCRASKHRNQQQRQRHFIILCIFSPCIFCIFNAPLYHSTVEREGEKKAFLSDRLMEFI